MAYEKQTWQTGDIITAEKLNHMEDGIVGGTLVIGGFSYDNELESYTGTSDKTWQEIDNALAAGVRCISIIAGYDGHYQLVIDSTGVIEGQYKIFLNKTAATTTSADGYPAVHAD
jgi:hypothetical protein